MQWMIVKNNFVPLEKKFKTCLEIMDYVMVMDLSFVSQGNFQDFFYLECSRFLVVNIVDREYVCSSESL